MYQLPPLDLEQHRRAHARIAQSLATHTGRAPWSGLGLLGCDLVGALLLALAMLPATLNALDAIPRAADLDELATFQQELHAGP